MNTASALARDLATVARLADEWPTDSEIRDDVRHGERVKVQGRRDMADVLPFHLDRTDNSEGTVRTRGGAVEVLRRVWQAWGRPEVPASLRRADMDAYAALCAALAGFLPRIAETLTGAELEASAAVLRKLAKDSERATAHGIESAMLACPMCHDGRLGRAHTSEGLADVYACDTCGADYTHGQLMALASAHARYGQADGAMTLGDAAKALGVPLKTLYARVARRGIKPAGRRGTRNTYRLADLR